MARDGAQVETGVAFVLSLGQSWPEQGRSSVTRSVVRSAAVAASFAFALAALAACGPPAAKTETAPASQATANDCAATAARTWTAGGVAYAVTIATSGATCADAQAALKVTAPDGAVVHEEVLPAATTFELRDAATVDAMTKALATVLDAGTDMADTGALPTWEKGSDGPDGEFPFIPEDGVDRTAYEKLRAAKAPMLCYVQGGESLGCWRLEGAKMVKIGAQTFPG